MLWLRFTGGKLTEDGRRDDDAYSQNYGRRDNGGGDIPVFQNFLLQMARRAFVKNLEPEDRGKDADAGENQNIADGGEQRLRVPVRGGRRWRIGGEQRRSQQRQKAQG